MRCILSRRLRGSCGRDGKKLDGQSGAWTKPVSWISSDSRVWIKELPMNNLFTRFLKDDSGATAIEYGRIAAGVFIAIIAVVNGLGSTLNGTFGSISSQLGGGAGS